MHAGIFCGGLFIGGLLWRVVWRGVSEKVVLVFWCLVAFVVGQVSVWLFWEGRWVRPGTAVIAAMSPMAVLYSFFVLLFEVASVSFWAVPCFVAGAMLQFVAMIVSRLGGR